MTTEKKPFWRSLPGILTGLAALITALTTLYITISSNGTIETSTKPVVLPTPSPQHPKPQKNDRWILAGEDIFTGTQTKWPSGSIELADGFKRLDTRVVGGKYRVEFEANKKTSRYFDSPYGAAINFRLAVDVKMVDFNSNHILAGVHFGYSSGVGYLFTILPTGKWGVHKTDAFDKPVVEWTNAGLNPKNWNRLEVEVDGNQVRLRINSIIVAEYKDKEMRGGILGVYVGSNDEKGIAVVDFDNFEYYRKESD